MSPRVRDTLALAHANDWQNALARAFDKHAGDDDGGVRVLARDEVDACAALMRAARAAGEHVAALRVHERTMRDDVVVEDDAAAAVLAGESAALLASLGQWALLDALLGAPRVKALRADALAGVHEAVLGAMGADGDGIDAARARHHLLSIMRADVAPSPAAFGAATRALAAGARWGDVRAVLSAAHKRGVAPDAHTLASIAQHAARDSAEHALAVQCVDALSRAPQRDDADVAALASALAEHGPWPTAQRVLEQLASPSAVRACADRVLAALAAHALDSAAPALPALVAAVGIVQRTHGAARSLHESTTADVCRALARHGRWELIDALVAGAAARSPAVYAACVQGALDGGRVAEALQFADEATSAHGAALPVDLIARLVGELGARRMWDRMRGTLALALARVRQQGAECAPDSSSAMAEAALYRAAVLAALQHGNGALAEQLHAEMWARGHTLGVDTEAAQAAAGAGRHALVAALARDAFVHARAVDAGGDALAARIAALRQLHSDAVDALQSDASTLR